MSSLTGPALNTEQLRERIRSPIGTPRLAGLASGRTRAVVIIDDISRPTPTPELLPLVLAELEEGGLPPERIRIVIAGGGHEPAPMSEHLKKLGPAIADRFALEIHDPEGDLVRAGASPSGIPLHINRAVMEADLKVGIGTIAPHDAAGYSGGSKILVPGVAGTETARYLHDFMRTARQRGADPENEFRHELDAITSALGLDFIVNVVLGEDRKTVGLFAGDRVLAHREGVRLAADVHRVMPPGEADVVIANAYPYDGDLWFVPWGFWPLFAARPEATRVVLADGTRGPGGHRLKPRASWLRRVWLRLMTLRPRHVHRQARHLATSLRRTRRRQALELLLLCPNLDGGQVASRFPAAIHYRSWDDLLEELRRRHGDGTVRVAVYPCAPLQIPEETS